MIIYNQLIIYFDFRSYLLAKFLSHPKLAEKPLTVAS